MKIGNVEALRIEQFNGKHWRFENENFNGVSDFLPEGVRTGKYNRMT